VELKIGEKIIHATFISAKNLSHDVIIGIDIIKTNDFVLDFENDELIHDGKAIELKTHIPNKHKTVCAATQIKIAPKSRYIYKAKCPPDMLTSPIMIEKVGRVDVIETIASVSSDIIIENKANIPITLKRNALICRLTNCEILNSINNVADVENFLKENSEVETVCSIDSGIVCDRRKLC
jgi:hypothetical protein